MNRFAPISRRRFLGTSAAALAASGSTATVFADAHGDTLRVRTPSDIVNVDPGFWQNTADLWTMDAILPKLINFKPSDKWEWELYCAESIEAVDAKTVNFKICPGLQWSNGCGELSAEDVKFSFERYLDPELSPPNSGNWALLDHVDVHDKMSGTIVFKKPFSALWWFVLPYATGSIVCKKAVEEAGGTYSLEPPAQGGPYKMVEHVPSQLIVLEAHSGWNGPQPEFKRVEFLPITDSKAAENAIQAGQLDVARVSLSIAPHLMENMPAELRMNLKSSPDNVRLGRKGWKSSSTVGSRRRTSTGPRSGYCRTRPASGTGSGTTARSSRSCTSRRWRRPTTPSATSAWWTCRRRWTRAARTCGSPSRPGPSSGAIMSSRP